jgi:hypothetical protein
MAVKNVVVIPKPLLIFVHFNSDVVHAVRLNTDTTTYMKEVYGHKQKVLSK